MNVNHELYRIFYVNMVYTRHRNQGNVLFTSLEKVKTRLRKLKTKNYRLRGNLAVKIKNIIFGNNTEHDCIESIVVYSTNTTVIWK